MVRIKSIEEIQNFTCFIRSLRKGLITNFYLNVEKHSIWIETGEFFVHETPECIFFLHEMVIFIIFSSLLLQPIVSVRHYKRLRFAMNY